MNMRLNNKDPTCIVDIYHWDTVSFQARCKPVNFDMMLVGGDCWDTIASICLLPTYHIRLKKCPYDYLSRIQKNTFHSTGRYSFFKHKAVNVHVWVRLNFRQFCFKYPIGKWLKYAHIWRLDGQMKLCYIAF